jgi:hypothetical protein
MNVRLQKTLHFTAGVWYDNSLQMNNYVVRINLYTNSTDPISQNIAFERLKYFVYYELDSSILIDQNQNEQCSQFVASGLRITTMPGAPVDQLVGIMLYYKLNAIMEQRLVITDVEISSNLGENLVYLHDEDENTDDIVKPEWWITTDLAHCDSDLAQSDKVVAIKRNSTWHELELDWPVDVTVGPGNIVVFADFKRNDTE